MMPLIHSYNNDMAEVSRMILVKGGSSFLINRGSRGVNVANWKNVSRALVNNMVSTYKLD